MRRVEQSVHQAFIGIGAIVVEVFADLFGAGGKAGKVETDAAEQGQLRGFGGGRNAFALQPRQNKVVHRIADPGAIPHRGRGGSLNLLERPVGSAGRPFHPLVDPRPQKTDLFRGEVGSHGRHEFLVDAGHQADQAALGALAGQDVRAGLAALECGIFLIEAEAAHLLLRAVADHAAFGKQRLDVPGEFDLDFGGGRQRDVGSTKRHARDQAGERATQHPHSEHRTYYIPAGPQEWVKAGSACRCRDAKIRASFTRRWFAWKYLRHS